MTAYPVRAARVPLDALPMVDMSAWSGGDASARRAVADAVVQACRDVGFMYVRGHGVPDEVVAGAFTAARGFFALSLAEKETVHYRQGGFRRGYIPLLAESTDPTAKGDLKEAFDLGHDPTGRPAHPGIEGGAICKLWPSAPADFRPAVEAYLAAAPALAGKLFAMLALGLGLDEG